MRRDIITTLCMDVVGNAQLRACPHPSTVPWEKSGLQRRLSEPEMPGQNTEDREHAYENAPHASRSDAHGPRCRDIRGFLWILVRDRADLRRLYRFLGNAHAAFHGGGKLGGFQGVNEVLGHIALVVGNIDGTAPLDRDAFAVRLNPDPGTVGVH